jgi:hypothetical protein
MAEQQRKKRKLSKQEAKQSNPIFQEFNKLSKAFIKLLGQKVESKRKSVHTLSVMVSDMKIPTQFTNSTINIQTLDMGKTKVKRKGSMSYNQKMSWEDDVRKRSSGTII